MRISTRLLLAVFVPVLMALVVSLALWYSYRATEITLRNGDIVRQMRTSISGLNSLVYSYIIYHDDRPDQQFASEYAAMSDLIAGIHLQNSDQQQLLDRIRLNGEAINSTFLKLVSDYENSSTTGSVQSPAEAETVLIGQLLIKLHNTDDDASLLRSLVDADTKNALTRNIVVVLSVVIVATVPLTYVLLRVRKQILNSLMKLRTGTEIVGSGNLEHRINLSTKDEIGELSYSFDKMTENLQAVTVSKIELQKEVAERQKAEEALQQYAKNLEVSNKELEAFSYSVSHDLRQPLRALDGFSQAVMDSLSEKLDETNKNYLDRVRKASQTMGRLIDDLLKLSRISRADMNFTPVSLSELAIEIAKELKQTQPERQAEFIIAPELTIEGDKPLLNIALRNLLENAWKYSRKCQQTRIEMGRTHKDGENAYFIRDHGVGFEMKYYNKLFQPFQRLHSGTEYEGTGIGLATVSRIIRRHGGRIWAESEVGQGTTIYFTLEKE